MEYSFARTMPVGWESLAGPRDTRSFWRAVEAEVERLGINKKDLNAVRAVRDRHLAFEALILALPVEMRQKTFTKVVVGAERTHMLTLQYPIGSDEDVLLTACDANNSVVPLMGTDYKASVEARVTLDLQAPVGEETAEFSILIAE